MTAPSRVPASWAATSIRGLGSWETTSWVTRYEPGRMFEWAVSDPDNPSATWWYSLDEVNDRVRLIHGGRMGPAPSGLSIAIARMPDKEQRIVARRLEEWKRADDSHG